MLLARWLTGEESWAGVAAVAAVVGHNAPLYHGFRGGKGVATTLGALLAYLPLVGISMLAVWLAAYRLSRISSVGALAAAAALPLLAWGLAGGGVPIAVGLILGGMMVVRHRSNIGRLLRGEEKPC